MLPNDVEFRVRQGETVLDAVVRSGYKFRIGCRRGGCGLCKAQIVQGTIGYSQVVSPGVLSMEERASGTCLMCRAEPASDVVVRLRDDDFLRCTSPLQYAAAMTEPGSRPG